MEEIKLYKTFDGKSFKTSKKAYDHEYKLIKNCFTFDYGNSTDGESDINEKHSDFEDYACDSKGTINNIIDLLRK